MLRARVKDTCYEGRAFHSRLAEHPGVICSLVCDIGSECHSGSSAGAPESLIPLLRTRGTSP